MGLEFQLNFPTRQSQNLEIHSEKEENKSEIKDFVEIDPKESKAGEQNKGISNEKFKIIGVF